VTASPGEPFDALVATAQDVPPLLAAMRHVLEVAAEFDTEDRHSPRPRGLLHPASRGDKVRRALLVGMVGEDGIAAAVA
jgi:hypothetical protein